MFEIAQVFLEKSRSVATQIKAILLLRVYRFKEDPKEKWTLLVSMITFMTAYHVIWEIDPPNERMNPDGVKGYLI